MHFHKYTTWKDDQILKAFEKEADKRPAYMIQLQIKRCEVCNKLKIRKVKI